MEVLKVSSKSNPNACAGALAGVLRQDGAVEVQVVGAGALNQAIKAVAIARGFVGSRRSRPARSRLARCAWTVDGEARPTASPISRTVGG